jgi:RNA polymerase sigma-70 factor (ECF subfamily)
MYTVFPCGKIGTPVVAASQSTHEITTLLERWRDGDREALDRLVAVVYPEIRRVARYHLRGRCRSHTLPSAALANEAYLKLVRLRGIGCENRVHFLALCAQVIRRVLIDHARYGSYAKRGGASTQVPFEETLLGPKARGVEVVELHDALVRFGEVDPRKARVVELRFFGGLSVAETAHFLGISPETVHRDWKMAKVWLYRELDRTTHRK